MVLNNKDTSICFTVEKSAFLLNRYYQSEEYKTLDSLCEIQKDSLYKVIAFNKQIIKNQKNIIDKQKNISNNVIEDLQYKLDEEHKNYLYERRTKWTIGILLGIVLPIVEYKIFIQ